MSVNWNTLDLTQVCHWEEPRARAWVVVRGFLPRGYYLVDLRGRCCRDAVRDLMSSKVFRCACVNWYVNWFNIRTFLQLWLRYSLIVMLVIFEVTPIPTPALFSNNFLALLE